MRAQLKLRAQRLAAGEAPLGWKVAFSAPAVRKDLNLQGSVVGFLTDSALVTSGSTCSVANWTKPGLEPEIAIHMGSDLPDGADRDRAAAAICGLGAAIELADLDLPPEQLEQIIATNIFQRRVILGPIDTSRAGGDASGIVARVYESDRLVAEQDDPCGVVGNPLDVACHVADFLRETGAGLSAGDVIISGSVVPMIPVNPGQQIRVELTPLGTLSVDL